jgi:S-adenosylmethionine:tRNA ribosyltransferase-isomerase
VKLADFDFALPPELIAQHPSIRARAARMLVIRGEPCRSRCARPCRCGSRAGRRAGLQRHAVIKARLVGKRGRRLVEVTLHRMVEPATWRAFARPAKRLAPGDTIAFAKVSRRVSPPRAISARSP